MPVETDILRPAMALVVWTLLIMFWAAATRFAAMERQGFSLRRAAPGNRGHDFEGILPPEANWKFHNYTHLLEQPTLFYPTVIVLALAGASVLDVTLAWIYVGTRIVHSLWQTLINAVVVRFAIFTVSSFVMLALALRAFTAVS